MKFEGSGSKGTRVIERKRSVTDGQTARRIDGQTDRAKTICLPQRGGDIIMFVINNNHNLSKYIHKLHILYMQLFVLK